MPSISSANSILILTVANAFPSPVQIQGFGPDEIYGIDAIAVAETSMGVDGNLSGGFVFTSIAQQITLQADSASNAFFDTWVQQEFQLADKFVASGTIQLPSLGLVYTLNRGFLETWPPIASGGKTLHPRRFGLRWNSITSAPIP